MFASFENYCSIECDPSFHRHYCELQTSNAFWKSIYLKFRLIVETLSINLEFTSYFTSGEDLCVRLSGVAMDVNIRLDKSTVRMENTFISLTTKRTVGIVNRSDVIAKFTWKLLSSAKEDEQFKERFAFPSVVHFC